MNFWGRERTPDTHRSQSCSQSWLAAHRTHWGEKFQFHHKPKKSKTNRIKDFNAMQPCEITLTHFSQGNYDTAYMRDVYKLNSICEQFAPQIPALKIKSMQRPRARASIGGMLTQHSQSLGWVWPQASHTPGVVAHICMPSLRDVEAWGSKSQDHPQLHKEFKASLGCEIWHAWGGTVPLGLHRPLACSCMYSYSAGTCHSTLPSTTFRSWRP